MKELLHKTLSKRRKSENSLYFNLNNELNACAEKQLRALKLNENFANRNSNILLFSFFYSLLPPFLYTRLSVFSVLYSHHFHLTPLVFFLFLRSIYLFSLLSAHIPSFHSLLSSCFMRFLQTFFLHPFGFVVFFLNLFSVAFA